MQIEVPIFRQILADVQLNPRELQVWRAAIEYLDLVEFRDLKVAVIENHLSLDRSTAWRALNALVHHGYLCREDGDKGGSSRFRVPLSRRHCEVESTNHDGMEVLATPEVTRPKRARSRTLSRGVL